ncbi:MAG: LuxR C-terminal-related transcriptional regulator [Anaerolineales bacterium]|nr:LuxR C-terminal-related transcriptional regulator [Anaerolineales bacterium]
MRARLGAGDVDRATHLAQSLGTGLPASLQTSLMVRQNRLDEALALLETALPTALAASSLEAVRLGIIQALAFFLQNNQTRALSALKQTLELAEPENCIAAFLREGAVMERLLRLALAKSIYPVFVQKLLAAFETRRQHLPAPASLAEPLHEPLSERELEVLHLLAQGCSDKDIAQSLVIARETVHKHLKNIYGKLDVHSRTEAVACARRLGLL